MSSTVIIVLIMNGGNQKYLCSSQTCFFPKTKYAPSIFGIQYTSCCRACFESLLDCFLRCVSLSSFTITTAFNS